MTGKAGPSKAFGTKGGVRRTFSRGKRRLQHVVMWKSFTIKRVMLLVMMGIMLSSTISLSLYELWVPRLLIDARMPLGMVNAVIAALRHTLRVSSVLSILVLLPLCAMAAMQIIRPLYSVHDRAIRMASGDLHTPVIIRAGGELGELANALNALSERVNSSQDALMVERVRALRILNALDEGILSVDENGIINQINPTLMAVMPVRSGDPLPDMVEEAFRAAMRENRQTAFNLTQKTAHGERIWACKVLPIRSREGAAIGAVGVFRDETQSIQLERTRRDYVANVSHELRSPLTALRCLIEPLSDGMIQQDEKKQEIYDILLRETVRLSRLVDDMLELSRLQSGALALEKMAFEPLPMLRQIADMVEPRVIDRGLTLERRLPESLPEGFGNPDRIEQVLIALLDNSIKFTPVGGVITMGAAVVAADNGGMGGVIEITVTNTGAGIAPEDLPHVFERFYKADKAHAEMGTGLGLAIARELLARLGETIRAENLPGVGVRFTFTLHFAQEENAAA
ncbi:MAG: cell wall metabolism sensor histidine kinase WalK [Oscillospiraceae bacterium]|jgi:two-component system sensor histidine kinase ResE|nr:cell wall metabolism sensor histidine kinase WalK [Oscillospiraceae bacterium]